MFVTADRRTALLVKPEDANVTSIVSGATLTTTTDDAEGGSHCARVQETSLA